MNRGGYKTKQRERILQSLKDNPDKHMSVDDIIGALNSRGETVGKTTVYRYVDKLCTEGLVRKYVLPEGEGACYQLCDIKCKEHFHLKCVECGVLIHTECAFLSEVASHVMKEHEFAIDSGLTVLYGMCGSCRNNSHRIVSERLYEKCNCGGGHD